MTRTAEIRVRAQDDARFALSLVSRDLADAMYVYDNTDSPIDLRMEDNPPGTPTFASVYYAKVDIVLPRMRGYCTATDALHDPLGVGYPREFPRHVPGSTLDEASPTCPYDFTALELRPIQPLAPDTKIVRYFIGLRDPSLPYANGYRNRLTGDTEDNMFILYRAEFSPFDNRLFPASMTDVNQRLSDSYFFYRSCWSGDPNPVNMDGDPFYKAWKKISRPVVTINDTDLVMIDDSVTPPEVTPTVRFMPTAIENDPMTPTYDSGDDPEHGDALPTVYKATYGHWVLPYKITVDPLAGKEVANASDRYYYEAMPGQGAVGSQEPPTDMCVYKITSSGSTFVFNITHYERTKADNIYNAGEIWPDADPANEVERAFTVDTMKGTANLAFPVVDQDLSDSLSGILGGNVAMSKSADTNAINATWTTSDPYRRLLFNQNNPPVDVERILEGSSVVPDSVRIIGPNVTVGYSTGYLRYSRLPFLLNDPGPNQYTVDLDYPVLDVTENVIPGTENTAAVYFNSLPTVVQESGSGPLPKDKQVYLYYEVQNNKKGDMLRASYTTKSLMTVIMGIRIYDTGTRKGRAELVQLTNKVRLRNVRT
jgi:hypothetical protein